MTIAESQILEASILIVDDQEANVSLLEQMLREAGYAGVASTMDPHEVWGWQALGAGNVATARKHARKLLAR